MPLQRSLENTLHGKCKIFLTKCSLAKIMKEQERERSSRDTARRPDFLPPPTELPLRHCSHNEEGTPISEVDCLIDLLAGSPKGNELPKNKQHFVLATADAPEAEARKKAFVNVREAARRVPGVPIVYVKRSVMILEDLSGASLGVRNGAEKEKLRDGLVGGRKRKRDEEDGTEGQGGGADDRNGISGGGAQKRQVKKVKGPNPLSVKKKKEVHQPRQRQGIVEQALLEGGSPTGQRQDTSIPKAKRKRKRGGKKDDGQGDISGFVADTSIPGALSRSQEILA